MITVSDMPHRCVRCAKEYSDTSRELLTGCSCGARVFVFLREGQAPADEDYAWLENELSPLTKDKPVSIDTEAAENLRILEKGSYEIDVKALMAGNPLVVKSEKGIYYIKMPKLK